MKTRLALLIIFYFPIFCQLHGQFTCTIEHGDLNLKSSGNIPNSNDYIPSDNTPVKYIRVNIHFILREPSHQEYPGNFTRNSDGNGNFNFTGYHYADNLINTTNSRLRGNPQMYMPPGNTTPTLQRKYQYLLNGVFFHEDNDYYLYPSTPNNKYGLNKGECINVFFNFANGETMGGHANMSGQRWVEIRGNWERYIDDIVTGRGIGSGIWVCAGLINHEIGHNLSLLHTMLSPGGTCVNDSEDYCSDTPTRGEIINDYGFDPCCGWGNNPNCTNNLMDYSGESAITPEQLGRVHWTIENEIKEYKTCYFTASSLTISGFTGNRTYIGENISISSGSSVLVGNNNALFINARQFDINGVLEISVGSVLSIETLPKCN